MNAMTSAGTMHRLVKRAVDSGQSATVEEAEATFRGYRLGLHVDDSRNADHHAALLTGVALGRRVFLGGV